MHTEPKQLQLSTAFGPSLSDALLIAHQLDESEEDGGHQRSFVLRIAPEGTKLVETLDHPVYQSWRSHNSTAYCTSNGGGIWIHDGQTWKREIVTDVDLTLGPIWGWSGATSRDDIVIAANDQNLFVRSNGVWQTHALPEDIEMVGRLHGLSATEVYLTTDYGLWKWDGIQLAAVEGPEGDLSGVRVLSDDEMVVTASLLFRWTTGEGWLNLPTLGEERHTIAIEVFRKQLYVGTANGVVRLVDDQPELINEVYCNLLVSVGDHLIAAGDQNLVFDGSSWAPIVLPSLARGGTP